MEDRQLRLSSTTFLISLARGVSVIGNPLFLVPLTVAATTRNLLWAAAIAITTTLPLVAIILRNVRRGTWSDFDVSRRDQRLGLYRAGLPLLLLAGIVLYAAGASPRMMRSVAAAAVIFAAGVLGHRFLKLSMHMMFAAFCAVILIRMTPWSSLGVVPFVGLVAWSRRYLQRHTWIEILIGAAIGTAAGLLAVL
jgi:membrane-associated phospholipid phosphatase